MKCTKCGDENVGEAKFCASCGEALSETPAPIHRGGGVTPVPADSGKVSKKMKIGILIGTIFFPLLGIIMGANYMKDANPAKKAVGRLWLMVGIGALVLWWVVTASLR